MAHKNIISARLANSSFILFIFATAYSKMFEM